MTQSEYNQCVDEWSDALYRFALKSLKDTDLAQDIVQDSFEKLWKKHEQIDNSKVKSYLFTIAYHAMVDYWRKQKAGVDIETVTNEVRYEQNYYSGLKPILDKALERLSEIQRTVLLLRDYEGYSYEEIGEICNLNASQVKVYIFRARLSIKNFIGNFNLVV